MSHTSRRRAGNRGLLDQPHPGKTSIPKGRSFSSDPGGSTVNC